MAPPPPHSDTPALDDQVFEIRLAGLVPAEVLRQVGETQKSAQELRTVLTGRFTDQAELYGFLARLRSLGLDIVEVRRVPTGEPDDANPDAG